MVAVFVLDGTQKCRFLNTVAETLTGVPYARAIGTPFSEVAWRNNPVPFTQTRLAEVLATGGAGEGEEKFIAAGHTPHNCAFRVVPLSIDGARIIELVDLSGETGTSRALRESERRLRLAVEATGIGIWDVDAVANERQWSPEFYAIVGLPPDSPADRAIFTELIHPEDRGWVDEAYRAAFHSPNAPPYDAEFRLIRASDHAERWVATTGRVTFDAAGKAIRGLGTLRDITARRKAEETLRESEERLRMALAAGRMGTWRWNLRSGQQQWDDSIFRLLGLEPQPSASFDLLRSAVLPEDLDKVDVDVDNLPLDDNFIDSEYRVRWPDGETHWIASHALMRYDRHGQPFEVIGVSHDITERKVLEERQRLVLREMNHRVKNSLAVVQAIVSQTIRMSRSPREAFERIQSRVMSVARTHDFLDRSTSADASLRKLITVEVEPFADDIATRMTLNGPHVMLESSSVLALGLTLHELATNSVKYGALSAPGGHIAVTWAIHDNGGDRPVIEIVWKETGGPKVRPPRRRGFGSRLIEGSVGGNLGGHVEVKYDPAGLEARLSFPLRPPLAV